MEGVRTDLCVCEPGLFETGDLEVAMDRVELYAAITNSKHVGIMYTPANVRLEYLPCVLVPARALCAGV
jgi:hypothetical protein